MAIPLIKARRGSVLVHVLVTSVLVSIIAAGLVRMLLLRYTAVERLSSGAAGKKLAESSLHRLVSAWNAANTVCASVPGSGFSCNPASLAPPGTCNCVCAGGGSTVAASIAGGKCRLTVTTP